MLRVPSTELEDRALHGAQRGGVAGKPAAGQKQLWVGPQPEVAAARRALHTCPWDLVHPGLEVCNLPRRPSAGLKLRGYLAAHGLQSHCLQNICST